MAQAGTPWIYALQHSRPRPDGPPEALCPERLRVPLHPHRRGPEERRKRRPPLPAEAPSGRSSPPRSRPSPGPLRPSAGPTVALTPTHPDAVLSDVNGPLRPGELTADPPETWCRISSTAFCGNRFLLFFLKKEKGTKRKTLSRNSFASGTDAKRGEYRHSGASRLLSPRRLACGQSSSFAAFCF